MKGATYTGGYTGTFSYTYDVVGNWTQQNANGTVTNYQYDNANRLTNVNGVTYTWDDNGNLLSDGSRTSTYDQANRLKTAVNGGTTTQMGYNGLGDRLSQTVNGTATRYVLDTAAGLTQVLSDGTSTYLYGIGRIAQQGSSLQHFGADALGSVRQLYNSAGQIIANRRYDPFGNSISQSGVGTTPYGFAGEWTDGTGLEYLRARYYDPVQGRFGQPDRLLLNLMSPQSLNLYAYALNNPVRYVDSSGDAPQNPGDPKDMPGPCTTPWCWQNRWYRAHGYEYDTAKRDWVVSTELPIFYDEAIKDEVIGEASITLCGQNCQDKTPWTDERKGVVALGVSLFGLKLSGGVPQLGQLTGGAVKVYVDNKPIFCERSCAPPPNPLCSGDDIYLESTLLDKEPRAYMDVVHELGHIIDWHSTIGGRRFSDAWHGAPITQYALQSPTPTWDRFAEAVATYVLGSAYFLRSPQTVAQRGMDIRDQMDRMQALLEGWY